MGFLTAADRRLHRYVIENAMTNDGVEGIRLTGELVTVLGRKRDQCRHCNKLLVDQEGILVDEDDNYECSDNPDGDHHQLKRK